MANNENLMQYRGSTPEERRANASKAGKASGEARRRKANLRQTMNAIEKGEYNPTIKLCRRICRILDKSLDDLFWEDDEDEENEK